MGFWQKAKQFKLAKASLIGACLLLLSSSLYPCLKEPDVVVAKDDETVSKGDLPDGDGILAKFTNSLTETRGLKGELSFSLTFADKDSLSNSDLSLSEASLAFYKDTDNFAFHLDGSLIYNDATLPLLAHFSSDDSYLSLLGARYSYSHADFDSFFDSVISIFGRDSIKIPDSFYRWLDSFLFKGDGGRLSDIKLEYLLEQTSVSSYLFSLSCPSLFSNKIFFLTDLEYNLAKVYGENLKGEGFLLSFSYLIKEDRLSYSDLLSLKPTDNESYTPLIDSMGIVRKAVEFSKSKKGHLSLEGTFRNQTNFANRNETGVEENFDLSANLDFDINNSLFAGEAIVGGYDLNDVRGTKKISFFNESDLASWKAYLTYNDIMKFSMDATTFDSLLALFEKDSLSEGFTNSLFSFLTESAAIIDIEKGRYDKCVSMISSIETSPNKIIANLSLKDFGFGEEATLKLTIDASSEGVLQAILENSTIASLSIDRLVITFSDYLESSHDTSNYFDIKGLPTCASQMQNLFQKKRANFKFNASVLDASGLGYPEISGNVYFDLNDGMKKGSGDVTLKHKVEDGSTKNNHVKIDVTGALDSDVTRFHYNDGDSNNEGMRGEMTIKDLNSIIAMAVELYNDDDPRFAKFFDPIKAAMLSNVVGALTANRYGPFIATSLIQKASLGDDMCVFVLDGGAFGLKEGSSFEIALNFQQSELTSIVLSNLLYGEKTINCTITLGEASFDDSKLSIVTDFAEGNYYRFDGIDVLLKAALNESRRESFRLYSDSVKVTLSVIGIDAISLNLKLDFYIYVKGEVVKVYGSVSNIGTFIVSRNYHFLASNNYRTSLIYYDNIDTEKTASTGVETALADQKGYLYVSSYNTYKSWGSEKKDTDPIVKYSTDQLSNNKNVLRLVLYDILGLSDTIYNKAAESVTGTKEKATAYENLLTQYSYTANDSNHPSWKVGVNLGALASNSILKELSVIINGGDYGSASEGYLSSLVIPAQTILQMTGISAQTSQSTIYNALPGTDYWGNTGAALWNAFVPSNRSLACSADAS